MLNIEYLFKNNVQTNNTLLFSFDIQHLEFTKNYLNPQSSINKYAKNTAI